MERIRNQFLYDILIKLEREKINFKAVKAFIQSCITDILTDKGLRAVSVVIDTARRCGRLPVGSYEPASTRRTQTM